MALSAALASASVGGGLYEFSVVDPFWPRRPDLVQPARGGISRKRFWIAIHVAFEVTLIAALIGVGLRGVVIPMRRRAEAREHARRAAYLAAHPEPPAPAT